MDTRELYRKVDEILGRVDFDGIWPEFSRFPFALYDEQYVYFQNEILPHDRRFLGNTSIPYAGGWIAIWNVADPSAEDPERLAADLTHEMFHAFQAKRRETRYPDDLLLLDYPDDLENFSVKYGENLLLAEGCLNAFFAARAYRAGLIGDMLAQEYRAEAVEGMAEYAGCMALKQISLEKYEARMCGYREALRRLDARLFEIRRVAYYTGAVLYTLLAERGLRSLPESTAPVKPALAADESLVAAEWEKYLRGKMARFARFFEARREEARGDFVIRGYDPMNMIKLDGMLLCEHFVTLAEAGRGDPLFVRGPVVVNLKKGSVNEAISYIK